MGSTWSALVHDTPATADRLTVRDAGNLGRMMNRGGARMRIACPGSRPIGAGRLRHTVSRAAARGDQPAARASAVGVGYRVIGVPTS
jgi:hypothetical protein